LKSRTTPRFRTAFTQLPDSIKRRARLAYRLFQNDPGHPSLNFKQIDPAEQIFSARVARRYRALARREGDVLIWFWIGTHADYDQMLQNL
jgi:hypothetical protein